MTSHHRRIPCIVALAVALLCTACGGGGKTGATSTTLDDPAPAEASNSASRVVAWISADECAAMSDATINQWIARGVTGFICGLQTLSGMTAPNDPVHEWSGSLSNLGDDGRYALEQQLQGSALVAHLRAHTIRAYLTFYTQNRNNPGTPLADWFDDSGWSNLVVPKVRELAAAAHALGFTGVGVDQEPYPGGGTWAWNYAGNTHTEAQVRAAAKARGQQFMQAILAGFPDAEVFAYGTKFPDTWDAVVEDAFHSPSYSSWVQVNFWDGATSVNGYAALRFTTDVLYKRPFPDSRWDDALQYAQNSMQAFVSQHWANWSYAAPRFFNSPAIWIDGGGGYDPSPVPNVVNQVAAFKRWGEGGEFYLYAYNKLADFDYGPYVPALMAASQPGIVDKTPPTLVVHPPPATVSSPSVKIDGTADDDLAVRSVGWAIDGGATGVATMTWKPDTGPMSWTFPAVPLKAGVNTITITAQNIKGLTTTQTIVVTSTRPS